MIIATTNGAVDLAFPRWLLFRLGLRWYAFVGYWPDYKGGPVADHYVYRCRIAGCGRVHVDTPKGFGRELRCKA